jgi:hypothetical protein
MYESPLVITDQESRIAPSGGSTISSDGAENPAAADSRSVAARTVSIRTRGAARQRLQQLTDALHFRGHHDAIAVIQVPTAHGASEAFGKARRKSAGWIAPLPQPLKTCVVSAVSVHGAQSTPLFFDAGESTQAILARASRALQCLWLSRTDEVPLLFEQLLQLGQQKDFLTQQFRQVLAAKGGIY